jgi:putative phosphoribosyl transferase
MDSDRRYRDRAEAGELLAQRLASYAGRDDVIVLALPRGGVPVGFIVAERLDVRLDVLLVRKLGFPGQEEFAMGAIASGGVCVLHDDAVQRYHISPAEIEQVRQRESLEIARREKLYRAHRPAPQLQQQVVIVIDDGIATGATMFAAIQCLRHFHPARIVVAVPVAPPETCQQLKAEVDEVICPRMPDPFYAVGNWYRHFGQTSDEEVQSLLAQADRDYAQHHPLYAQGSQPPGRPHAGRTS